MRPYSLTGKDEAAIIQSTSRNTKGEPNDTYPLYPHRGWPPRINHHRNRNAARLREGDQMSKHFELAEEKRNIGGRIVYRVQALIDLPHHRVKAGDLGGFVQGKS